MIPPDARASGAGEVAALATFDEFAHGVLQEGKAAWLVADVAHDLVDESGLEVEAGGVSGFHDRSDQVIVGGERDGDEPATHELAKAVQSERLVEDVGAQRDHDATP